MAGNPVASFAAPTVIADAATQVIDCTQASQFSWTLGANRTVSAFLSPAGGQIIVQPTKRGYAKLSKEDILALNPDVILDFIHGPKSRFAGDPMEAWQALPELKAVRTKRVYGIKEDYVPHASQRVVLTAELFARLLHPEAK